MSSTYFWFVRPTHGRRTYAVRCRVPGQPSKKVKDARVDGINRLIKLGAIDHQQAEKLLNELLVKLRKNSRPGPPAVANANVDIVDRYWKEEYEWKVKVRKPETIRSARNALDRVVKAMGPVSLTSASFKELNEAVGRTNPEGRKALVMRMNCLLKWLGRSERVKLGKQAAPKIRYVTLPQLHQLVAQLKKEYQLPVLVAFATGARQGEIFSLQRTGRQRSVWIDQQRYKDGASGDTKNKNGRWAPIVGPLEAKVKEWIALPAEEKMKVRKKDWARIVHSAARKAKLDEHLTFHDLRHSYAVYWLDLGAPEGKVAEAIGDSLEVFWDHYKPYIQTEAGESLLLKVEAK